MIFLYNYFDYLVILSNPMFSTQLMDSSPNFTKHHKLEKEHKMYSRELMESIAMRHWRRCSSSLQNRNSSVNKLEHPMFLYYFKGLCSCSSQNRNSSVKQLEHPMFLYYFKGLLLQCYTLLNGITQQAQWLIFGGNKVDAP